MIQGGVASAALMARRVWLGVRADSRELAKAGEAMVARRCILCNTAGAGQAPHIGSS